MDWTWRTEVPVTADPRDRRTIDAVLASPAGRVGAETIVRLVDAQGQTRPILLKQETTGLACMILVLADTRNNRAALAAGEGTIRPAFPCGPRETLAALRRGSPPPSNGIVVV